MKPRSEVVCDPAVMSGDPVVSGTRILAETILGYLRSDEPVEAMPTDGIAAVVRWAEATYGLGWKTAAAPPFSLDFYELHRDPDETDEDFAFRRSLFAEPAGGR